MSGLHDAEAESSQRWVSRCDAARERLKLLGFDFAEAQRLSATEAGLELQQEYDLLKLMSKEKP